MHQKCFQCNKFLGGIVLTTIYCETCQQYFHLHCYELDTSKDTTEGEEEEDGEEIVNVESGNFSSIFNESNNLNIY